MPLGLNFELVSDGHAQLLGATGGNAGICLAVGTGSVMHWLGADGQAGMAGGWGYPVGDEGSGAWLGMKAIQHYIWHIDGRRRRSSLIEAISGRVGTSVAQIQQWSTESQSSVLAQLAPMVFEDQLRPLLAKSIGNRISKAKGDALHGLWQISQRSR